MAPPLKQFCLNGHDTLVVGRTAQNRCRECRRFYQRRFDAARRDTPERQEVVRRAKHKYHRTPKGRAQKQASKQREDPLRVGLYQARSQLKRLGVDPGPIPPKEG